MLLFMRITWLSANAALGPATSRGKPKALKVAARKVFMTIR